MSQVTDPIILDSTGQDIVTQLQAIANELNVQLNQVPRPNLLLNPWFTVNQRGWASGANVNGSYCVDRWKMDSGGGLGTIAVSSSGITLTPNSAEGAYIDIQQLFENTSELIGKTITASIMLSDGTIYSGTGTVPSGGQITPISEPAFGVNVSASRFMVYASNDTALSLRAVKLEIGETSTLAYDVAPNYTEELLKCQRYFVRIKSEAAKFAIATISTWSSSEAVAVMYLPVKMRTLPTLSTAGSFILRIAGADNNVSTLTLTTSSDNIANFYITSSGLVAGQSGRLCGNSGTEYIDLSAEL